MSFCDCVRCSPFVAFGHYSSILLNHSLFTCSCCDEFVLYFRLLQFTITTARGTRSWRRRRNCDVQQRWLLRKLSAFQTLLWVFYSADSLHYEAHGRVLWSGNQLLFVPENFLLVSFVLCWPVASLWFVLLHINRSSTCLLISQCCIVSVCPGRRCWQQVQSRCCVQAADAGTVNRQLHRWMQCMSLSHTFHQMMITLDISLDHWV